MSTILQKFASLVVWTIGCCMMIHVNKILFQKRFFINHELKLISYKSIDKITRNIQNLQIRCQSTVSNLRNIGIMAHIDAGKTTTTERMLFYSGELDRIGEVHDGDTVMDYLDQERERGITINSAAISFEWNSHRLNLIDTPGHVDFTMEVERSLRVMDGAIAIFDAVSGVQAQTETVWRQATRYGLPRLGFINKMDRPGADFNRVVKMIGARLDAKCWVTQLPYFRQDDGDMDPVFRGVLDVVDMKLLSWDGMKSTKEYSVDTVPEDLIDDLLKAREALAENISEIDDDFAEQYLESSIETMDPALFKSAIRRACISDKHDSILPVLCGSALKNTGVQKLMDAVVDYFPAPEEAKHQQWSGHGVTALAFKVQQDPRRGPLVYVRVYSGSLESRGTYFNLSHEDKEERAPKERANQLLRAYADDFEPIEEIQKGDIGVVVGLKHTRTGDTLSDDRKADLLPGIQFPVPVFSVALEMNTVEDERNAPAILEILTRDDPSLRVVEDPETGQLLLCGMGELHLEIAKHKLMHDLKLGVEFGKVRVALRESLFGAVEASATYENPSDRQATTIHLSVEPASKGFEGPLEMPQFDNPATLKHLNIINRDTRESWYPTVEQKISMRNGIHDSLQRGPKLGYPVQGVSVTIDFDKSVFTSDTPPSSLRAAIALSMKKILENKRADGKVLEPLAKLQISVPDTSIGAVMGDINGNLNGLVLGAESDTQSSFGMLRSTITAKVPLRNLIGYSTKLRSMTAGEGTFSLEVEGYAVLTPNDLQKVIHENY